MHKTSKRSQKRNKQAMFLTADEAHEIIGKDKISRRSFYNALERKEIPNVRFGRRILIPRTAFFRMLEAGGMEPQNGVAVA